MDDAEHANVWVGRTRFPPGQSQAGEMCFSRILSMARPQPHMAVELREMALSMKWTVRVRVRDLTAITRYT